MRREVWLLHGSLNDLCDHNRHWEVFPAQPRYPNSRLILQFMAVGIEFTSAISQVCLDMLL